MAKDKTPAVQGSTGLAVRSETELAIANALADNQGSGFEEADATSFAIPFLSILQALSPQCKKGDASRIDGAEEGFFFNSVSGEIYDGEVGIDFIPAYYTNRFIAWGLREEGGGFKGEYMPSDPIVCNTSKDDRGRDIINGQPKVQLVDTRVHYGLLKNKDGAWEPAVLSLSSTQVKKSKQWMSRMQALRVTNGQGMQVPAAMFSHIWHLTTVSESNDHGSWFGLKIGDATPLTDPRMLQGMELVHQAMTFKESVQAGTARPTYEEPPKEKDVEEF